ncbi:MAG: ABC transporter ATP-binding protein [Candidatus Korarchaeota archaeon]|nr:ABC transporter ATP-binding protein [Thermoproteota archaeon]MCR8462936.1 ABC transporter ATP-binding protein [Thermoproteota archaeon]
MILAIKDLTVRYKATRYSIAHIKDSVAMAELSRHFLQMEKESVHITFINRKFKEKVELLLRKELEKFKKTGIMSIYALNGVNLDVDEGKVVAVIGESGSGKSTLALAILRILPENAETSGDIIFGGESLFKLDEEKMRLKRAKEFGYIGQGSYTYLNPLMEGAFQIFESSLVAAKDLDEASRLFIDAIKTVKLDSRTLLSYPEKLSGGEVRRVAIAIALAKNPRLLICDEPFKGIDPYMAMQLVSTLRELKEKLKVTMLILTHDLPLMVEIADEIAVIYHGIIVEKGPLDKVFSKPVHPYTKGLIGALPDIRNPEKKLVYVPGEPLPRTIRYDFCPFANRCPRSDENCLEMLPKLKKVDDRQVACVKADEFLELSPIEFWGPYLDL